MTLKVVDMHTAAEPVRIVESGYPELVGATLLEKRRDARTRFDHLAPRHDAGAARSCRHVWRHSHHFDAAGRGLRRAVHPSGGLQHHVRPRHHRAGALGGRYRPCAHGKWCCPFRAGSAVRPDRGRGARAPGTSPAGIVSQRGVFRRPAGSDRGRAGPGQGHVRHRLRRRLLCHPAGLAHRPAADANAAGDADRRPARRSRPRRARR